MQCDATGASNQRNGSRATSRARAAVCLSILTCSLLHSGAAHASKADIRTTANGCADHDGERLDELLAIEAGTIASEHPARPSDVLLSCRGGVVSVRVSLRDGSGERTSVVDPGAADRAARTRLLALAISELLAELWSEVPAVPAPAPRAAPPPNERPAAPPRREPAPTWVLHGGAVFRSMLEPRTGLLGGTLGGEFWWSPSAWFGAFGVDFEGAFGSVRSEHALVDVAVVSTAIHAVVGRRFGDIALGAGPGVRLGVVRFSPVVDDTSAVGHDVSGPWAGPFALAFAQWTKSRIAIRASVELGVTTLPFAGTVNGQTEELAMQGAWFAASVGAGAAF